jgi:hypothetical protein
MNWFKRRFLIIFASAVAIAAIGAVGIPFLHGGSSSQDSSHPGLGIALAAPLLQTAAFPEEDAGFSAYLDVGDAIQNTDDLADVATVCTEFPVELGTNHLLCEIDDNDLSLVNIHLYADKNGLVVAFFDVAQPTSRAAIWSRDEESLEFEPGFDSPTLALDEIIKRAVEKVGVDYESEAQNTGYYHWNFDKATVLTVISKTSDILADGTYFFLRPDDTLFEASATGFAGIRFGLVTLDDAFTPILNLNSFSTTYRGARREDNSINLEAVAPNVLHKVDNKNQTASAIYLLWTPAL